MKVCRICRSSNDSVSFISINGAIRSQLFQLCGINIEDRSDSLHPALICQRCSHDLGTACWLQKQAIDSDTYFQQIYKSEPVEAVNIIKEEVVHDLVIKDLGTINEGEMQWDETDEDSQEYQDTSVVSKVCDQDSSVNDWFKPQLLVHKKIQENLPKVESENLREMMLEMSNKLEALTGRVARLESGQEFQQRLVTDHNGVKVQVNPSLDLVGFVEPNLPIKSDRELDDFSQRLIQDAEFKSKMTTYLSTRCTKGSSSKEHFGLARSVLSTILDRNYCMTRCGFSQKGKDSSEGERKLLNHIVPLKNLMLDVFNFSQFGAKYFTMMHVEKGMQEYFKRLRENSRKLNTLGEKE